MPTVYSALLASILYEDVKKELRRTQADEVDMQNILAKAIDCCRQAAGSFRLSGCDASGAPGAVAGHSGQSLVAIESCRFDRSRHSD